MKQVLETANILKLNTCNNNAQTFSIQEQAVMGHAEKIKSYTGGKVRFNAILQTCGDTNQNKRVYSKEVMVDGVNRILSTIKSRNFLGELDHPISTNQVRQTTVLYKECSHMINAIEFRGDQIWGEIETLPYSTNGKIMSGLVLDKVSVGFSLRGLADLEDNGTFQKVLAPLIMISYDAVQQPSHKQASIQEVHQESFKRVVNESRDLIRTNDGKCYLPNLFDELVERKIINLHESYWKIEW